MKEISLSITYRLYSPSELCAADAELVEAARQATYRSYAPYSHFSVGAAVRLADGTLLSGSNQENAAYPSGLCAERTTLFYANSRYPEWAVRTLAIAARGSDGAFLTQPIIAGTRIAARTPMIAITTISSISVKPLKFFFMINSS